MSDEAQRKLTLFGRSSSHFTRVVRIFAVELDIKYEFRVIRDLMSLEPGDYGGNPALKLPVLHTQLGSCFGALNICRELARLSTAGRVVYWPESSSALLLANAHELMAHAMSTEVTLVMSKLARSTADDVHQEKMSRSLMNSIAWLEANVDAVLRSLPQCDFSYLEVSLFCLVTHLEFRKLLSLEPYPQLVQFAERLAKRASAQATSFYFDA